MPRPSLKTQRSEEILNAYMTCVARFGLEGATQERIAEEAGVKRPLLRHYLGNRDQMIEALNEHVVGTFNALTGELDQVLQYIETSDQLVEVLFASDGAIDPRLMTVWQSLTTSVGDYPSLAQPLLETMVRFLAVLEETFKRTCPDADAERIRAVAQGVSSIFVSFDSLSPLKPPETWRDELKSAALLLTSSLEPKK